MREPLPPPQQNDQHRKRFWTAFATRYPALKLRYGNTFARWGDVPATELVVSYNISMRGVGVFVRGQRGIPVRETATQLASFSLELALGCPMGNPNFPFIAWLRTDTFGDDNWPVCHDWLYEAGERYIAVLAEIVGDAR